VAGPLAPSRTTDPTVEEVEDLDRPWVTIVWNDPVNLMTYVTHVLRELFGYDEPTATTLMLQVHNDGRAVVSSGPRERMEHDPSRLHACGQWAAYQQDELGRFAGRGRASARAWSRPNPASSGCCSTSSSSC